MKDEQLPLEIRKSVVQGQIADQISNLGFIHKVSLLEICELLENIINSIRKDVETLH